MDNASAHICHALDGLALFSVWPNAYQTDNDQIVIRLPGVPLDLPGPESEDDGNDGEKGEDGQDNNMGDPCGILRKWSWHHAMGVLVCPADQVLLNKDRLSLG